VGKCDKCLKTGYATRALESGDETFGGKPLNLCFDCYQAEVQEIIKNTPKVVKDEDEAWAKQQTFGGPHGWVQWKGTDVCMDYHCKCGAHAHLDSWFAYYVKCPECGTIYFCNGHIELIEVTNPSGQTLENAKEGYL